MTSSEKENRAVAKDMSKIIIASLCVALIGIVDTFLTHTRACLGRCFSVIRYL